MKKKNQKKARKGAPAGKRKDTKVWDLHKAGFLLQSLMDKEVEILQTEEALIESMRRFRDLFEQSPIGVGIHDPKGELLIVNKAWLDIFGLRSFDGMKNYNLFKDFRMDGAEARKIREGKVAQYETECEFGKTGLRSSREGACCLLYIVSPLFRDKDIIGYMTQVQDVTERRKIAEAQRLAQLGRLIADMAHEVNNPLMIMSGRAELALLDGVADEKLKETMNIIVDQCFFAKDIIQRLLKYSRVGKVEKKPVDVAGAIGLVVDILGHHMRMADVTVKKHLSHDLPPVNGNEKQLQEVFMNILHNSVDAMPGGGTVTVSARREGDFVRIDIADTGEGMSRKVLERVFEPFFTTKQKGTGLGLAVCQTIIREHGGELSYESKLGSGTTASLLLPTWKGDGKQAG